MHEFDRLARNRENALAIKSLLRRDFGIKVFSVAEPSEDSDGPIGALMKRHHGIGRRLVQPQRR